MNTEISLKEIFYPFSWKKPWVYISLVISACLCIYLFFIHCEEIKLGIMETSISAKVFSLFVINWFPFALFRSSNTIKNVKSVAVRGLLLLGTVFIVLLVLGFVWKYAKYDNEKVDTYWRILPFKNSPTYKVKTLYYKDIKSIIWRSNESGTFIYYGLNDDKRQGLAIYGESFKSRRVFHINLCNEYNHLKDDIEKEYGPEYFENIDINEIRYERPSSISGAIWHTIFIWGIIVQMVCLLFYTFKIRLHGV